MVFYQPIAISYRGDEFPSTLIYESEEEADKIKYDYKRKLQEEFDKNGSNVKLEDVVISKVVAVFTSKTKRNKTIDSIFEK